MNSLFSSLNLRLRGRYGNQGPLFLAVVAVAVGVCLLLVFAVLLMQDGGVANIARGEPTPFPTPVLASDRDVIVAGVSGSSVISMTLNVPSTLRVGGQNFRVQAEPVEQDGTWAPELADPQTALWVYGTVINYVFGLADEGGNADLLEGLAPGEQLSLTLSDGMNHLFAVTNREFVDTSQSSDVFTQTTPGITLLLLGTRGDERLVIQGEYVVDTTNANGGMTSNVVELGETAQLGDLRLVVTEASSAFNQPGAPPGFNFYLIDYQVQNTGDGPIDLSRMRYVLRDDLGNQYALSPQATQSGNYPPLTGTLAVGESRQASVGYQIPAGLSSPSLSWIVSREGGSGEIQVLLPFAGSSEEAARNAAITLQSATVSADGTSVDLVGQIANSGSQPLIVSVTDVSLQSDGTVHLMLSTNPAFPWVVAPGQTLPFAVSFQRPGTSEAFFTVLSQPFQLSGLR